MSHKSKMAIAAILKKTGSSAMAEGPRNALGSIEKACNRWMILTYTQGRARSLKFSPLVNIFRLYMLTISPNGYETYHIRWRGISPHIFGCLSLRLLTEYILFLQNFHYLYAYKTCMTCKYKNFISIANCIQFSFISVYLYMFYFHIVIFSVCGCMLLHHFWCQK